MHIDICQGKLYLQYPRKPERKSSGPPLVEIGRSLNIQLVVEELERKNAAPLIGIFGTLETNQKFEHGAARSMWCPKKHDVVSELEDSSERKSQDLAYQKHDP